MHFFSVAPCDARRGSTCRGGAVSVVLRGNTPFLEAMNDRPMETSIERARFNMIEQQIRPWNVSDERVLATMAGIPREEFAPQAYRNLAYADIEIPIDEGQVMLAPKLVARMLQALAIRPTDKILEIGTGTGFVTACLARLGGPVASIEIHPTLAEQARKVLGALQLGNLEVREGNGLQAPTAGAPFDAIAVTGSLPNDEALAGLQDQLKPGGRLFAVVGEDPIMEALLVTREAAGRFRRELLFETSVPVLEGAPEPKRFVF